MRVFTMVSGVMRAVETARAEPPTAKPPTRFVRRSTVEEVEEVEEEEEEEEVEEVEEVEEEELGRCRGNDVRRASRIIMLRPAPMPRRRTVG